jgi:mitochondrial enoyl-[acyl-carrier protein] reductase / trans-2-enoyl-CoA reductase
MHAPRALVHGRHGEPAETLRWEPLASPPPGPGEAVLEMRAAAIHPSDFGLIQGSYGRLRELPAVAGREGVAEVVELGEGVSHLEKGDRVRLPEATGAWRERLTTRAADLTPLPRGLPDEILAQTAVNPPTALLLLREFVSLTKDQWVVQNAANSAVGRAVIQLCRSRGIRTLNLVRRPELAGPLRSLGADEVVVVRPGEKPDMSRFPRAVLGLNSVGGESLLHVVSACAPGATIVTFGGMTGEPIRFPTRRLIFDDLVFRGFWLDAWKRKNAPAAGLALDEQVFGLLSDGALTMPEPLRFRLSEWPEALAAARAPRSGPVLFAHPAP